MASSFASTELGLQNLQTPAIRADLTHNHASNKQQPVFLQIGTARKGSHDSIETTRDDFRTRRELTQFPRKDRYLKKMQFKKLPVHWSLWHWGKGAMTMSFLGNQNFPSEISVSS